MQHYELDFSSRLNISLRARVTLIVVMTPEGRALVSRIQEVCEGWEPPASVSPGTAWTGTRLLPATKTSMHAASWDPLAALDEISKTDENAVIILKDFHEYWNNPQVKRRIRSFSQKFRYNRRSIVIVTPVQKVPEEIRDEAVRVHFPPPSSAELSANLDQLLETSGITSSLSKTVRERIIQAALGMTLNQARRSFSKVLVTRGTIDNQDIDTIIADKKEILSHSDALEFYSLTETPDNVGVLWALKDWLHLRERAFTSEAREYGLPAPKGIALIGIPWTGKSLTAKMIAPCILWVDEIEKAFAFGSGDAGKSQRVFLCPSRDMDAGQDLALLCCGNGQQHRSAPPMSSFGKGGSMRFSSSTSQTSKNGVRSSRST